MKHFSMKAISVLLTLVMFIGFVPFRQFGLADGSISSIDDFLAYRTEGENGVITLKFDSGNYVFNGTVELEADNNYVIIATGSDVCFSHGAFSGEMFFVPESSSLTVLGVENDPASPLVFINTCSFEDLMNPAEPPADEMPEEPESYSDEGESGSGSDGDFPDAVIGDGEEYGENFENMTDGYEELTEVFEKTFSTLALEAEPLNLRAIVAEGPLSLKNVSFKGFLAAENVPGAAVFMKNGNADDSAFRFVTFKDCKDSSSYALYVSSGRTVFLENVTAEDCRIKNDGGIVTCSSADIGEVIDGGFDAIEEVAEEIVEELEEPVKEVIEESEEEIVEEIIEEPEEEIVEEIIEEPEEEIVEEIIEEPEEIVEEIIEEPEEIVEEIIEEPKEEVVEEIIEEPKQELIEEINEEPKEEIVEEKKVDIIAPSQEKAGTQTTQEDNKQTIFIKISWPESEKSARIIPEKVVVRLKAEGQEVAAAEISSAMNWQTTVEVEASKLSIEESNIEGYETDYRIDGNNVEIIYTPVKTEEKPPLFDFKSIFKPKSAALNPKTEVAVTSSDSAEIKENDVTGEIVEATVTSGADNESQENQNTQASVQQEQPAQQQTVQSYIDNAPKQSIIVSANWTDNNNSARRRPGKTQVSLYLNNALYMNASLSAENNWTYTFSNLTPGYSYRVEQSSVADYSTSYWTSGNTVYISNQYTGTQPVPSTTQQNIQQGYNNPQNAYNQQTQYPNNAVQSTSAPTVSVTPAPASASPVPTPVPAFAPTPTRAPVVPTSEPIAEESRSTSHAWIWIALLIVSAGAIAAVLISMNKARKQREAQEAARERARKRAAEAEMRKAQADISEGVRRTQNAERREQQPRQTQSREAYSRSQTRDPERTSYRSDVRHREVQQESSHENGYRPKH